VSNKFLLPVVNFITIFFNIEIQTNKPEQASMIGSLDSCGLCYKNIMIVNDTSEVLLQVVASPTIVILTTLEVSFMLLENIYSTDVTHGDHHLRPSYFHSKGCWHHPKILELTEKANQGQ
jgi:hypothetical protein